MCQNILFHRIAIRREKTVNYILYLYSPQTNDASEQNKLHRYQEREKNDFPSSSSSSLSVVYFSTETIQLYWTPAFLFPVCFSTPVCLLLLLLFCIMKRNWALFDLKRNHKRSDRVKSISASKITHTLSLCLWQFRSVTHFILYLIV